MHTLSILVSVALCLCGSAQLQAALDPETKSPYRLQVVLHVAKHRLLTDYFKHQVESDLKDWLQAELGDMAQVEVVREHPRLDEIEKDGLQSLDGWKEVSGVKTHFVLIDLVGGQYQVQARQYDGLTGQASSVVRRTQVSDRKFVARTAALRLELDFGLVGMLADRAGTPVGSGNCLRVRMTIKGSGLGVPVDRWLKKGDVFALVQVGQDGAGRWADRVPWALVQLEELGKDGECTCLLYHRHKDPLALRAGGLGFRCLKLGTRTGQLQLRFLEDDDPRQLVPRPLTPRSNLQVHVRKRGFDGEDKGKVEDTTDPEGFFLTRETYENIAFVSVVGGGSDIARIPVPIIDDQPIVVRYSGKEESITPLRTLRDDLWHRLSMYSLAQAARNKQINELMSRPEKSENILKVANESLQKLREDIDSSTREMRSLRQKIKDAARGSPDAANLILDEGEDRIKKLQEHRKDLGELIDSLAAALKEEPKRQERNLKYLSGLQKVKEAEFGEALKLFQEILDADPTDTGLKKDVEDLKEAWKVVDDRHAQARSFIYDTWPTLDLDGLGSRMAQANDALKECQRVKDRKSPHKLLLASSDHIAKLSKQSQAIDPNDQQTIKTIIEVNDGLRNLLENVTEYLKQK